MKRTIIYILAFTFFLSFLLGIVSQINNLFTINQNIPYLGVTPVFVSLLLLFPLIILWNSNKSNYIMDYPDGFRFNKSAILTCGFTLSILDIIFCEKFITVYQYGIISSLILILLVFESKKIKTLETNLFDRFMFNFSNCILATLVYSFSIHFYYVIFKSTNQEYSFQDLFSTFFGVVPDSLSRFFVTTTFSIIISAAVSLFFSNPKFGNDEHILDEEEIYRK